MNPTRTTKTIPRGFRRMRIVGGPDDGLVTIVPIEQRRFKTTHGLILHVYYAAGNGRPEFVHEDEVGGLQ